MTGQNDLGSAQKPKRFRSANWIAEEELTLIALYRQYEKGSETRKVMWENLAGQLNGRGFIARKGASLEQKWNNLQQTYRAIRDHDTHQGGPRFFDLDVSERKQLLYEWKVNSMEAVVYEALDQCLRAKGERGRVLGEIFTSHAACARSSRGPCPILAMRMPAHMFVPPAERGAPAPPTRS